MTKQVKGVNIAKGMNGTKGTNWTKGANKMKGAKGLDAVLMRRDKGEEGGKGS